MKTRSAWVAACLAAALIACGGPYKGKPDKLPRGPKKRPVPEEVAKTDEAKPIPWDEDCKAKFAEDPFKAKKSPTKAKPFVAEADGLMDEAPRQPNAVAQVDKIIAAIETYKKALLEDNYNAPATYGLAVAYAQVYKKGCAIKMLERLASLGENTSLVSGGKSVLEGLLDAVEGEPAFKGFKNDAMSAIGR